MFMRVTFCFSLFEFQNNKIYDIYDKYKARANLISASLRQVIIFGVYLS